MSDPEARWSRFLRDSGLAAPARLLLDAHRPLRPLMVELLFFASPALRPLLGHRYAALEAASRSDERYDAFVASLDDAQHR